MSNGRHVVQYRDSLMPLLPIDANVRVRSEGMQLEGPLPADTAFLPAKPPSGLEEAWTVDPLQGLRRALPLRVDVSRESDVESAFATVCREYGGVDIVVSRIYQGLLQRPAKGIGNNYLPSFSPDGTRVAFTSSRDGNYEIYVANVDEASAAEGNELSRAVVERAAKDGANAVVISAKIEEEISQLPPEEAAMFLEEMGLRYDLFPPYYEKNNAVTSVSVQRGGQRQSYEVPVEGTGNSLLASGGTKARKQ